MEEPQIDFSIIIPTHNREEGAYRAIESCVAQNYPMTAVEILIVANPPSQILADWIKIKGIQNIRILNSTPNGVNRAKNKGLANAKGKFVVFLDDDCTLDNKDHLSKLKEFFDGTQTDGIGGLYKNPSQISWCADAYNKMANLWIKKHVGCDFQALQLLGGNSAFHLQSIRGFTFDENIKYGADEVTFNSKLLSAGKTLRFCESLTVTHHEHGNIFGYLRRVIRQGWNKTPATQSYFSWAMTIREFQSLNIGKILILGALIGIYQLFGQGSALARKFLFA